MSLSIIFALFTSNQKHPDMSNHPKMSIAKGMKNTGKGTLRLLMSPPTHASIPKPTPPNHTHMKAITNG